MAFNPANTFSNSRYLFDGISPFEGVYFLLKKSFGYPDTLPRGSVTGEVTNNYNSYPFITLGKQYNQEIPQLNPNDFILDPTWSNFGYRSLFRVFASDSVSQRYYSSKYPYIALYSNLRLTALSEEGVVTARFGYTGVRYPSYGHTLLVNAIPFTFVNNSIQSNIYSWRLSDSNNIFIDPVNGYWLCDTDSGVITFFDSNTSGRQITNSNPPNFTFYRYEGLMGTTNVASTQDL